MASQREANILQQNWERDQRALTRAQRNQTPEPDPPPPPPAEEEEETPCQATDLSTQLQDDDDEGTLLEPQGF